MTLDGDRNEVYLSAFAIYRDEADYLREWIEFHKLVGFERFYLYNNFSTDHHREVLRPYIADGTVVHHEWPVEPAQMAGYRDMLERCRDETFWLAIFDIDEYLFSPTGEQGLGRPAPGLRGVSRRGRERDLVRDVRPHDPAARPDDRELHEALRARQAAQPDHQEHRAAEAGGETSGTTPTTSATWTAGTP